MKEYEHPPVSAYVITYNDEDTIEQTLQSLAWADEIVVVDSFSSDRTMELAGKYAHKLEQHPFSTHKEQYRYAVSLCSNDWALGLDSDEVLSSELIVELREALEANETCPEEEKVSAFDLQRRTYFLGRWHLRGGWGRDHVVRLFDRNTGDYEGGLHAQFVTSGKVGALKQFILHYSYTDIADQIDRMNGFSSKVAGDLFGAGKRPSLLKMVGNPVLGFFRDFILHGGFLEGTSGFVAAANSAIYVFWKYAKLWEKTAGFPRFSPEDKIPRA